MKKLMNRCPICGKSLEKFKICRDCLEGLKLNPPANYKNPYIKDIFIAFEYSGIGKELIRRYKFKGESYLVYVIGDLMIKRILSFEGLKDFSYITYVPMTKKKMAQRGFNQSLELAKYIGKNLDLEFISSFKKIKETKEQVGLSGSARKVNLKNSFALDKFSKNIIIVDDVITTSSTISELAKLAYDEGIKVCGLIGAGESMY
ncbi:ComF family protein [Peptoniphilus raoultii]|uniref:ComF family protein n=1 Tax=Peptoniphilus raoultii TaxID=1776387 RepID=UPI0008DA221D|nr:ComF family protein [Peptoniphilus raoultii]